MEGINFAADVLFGGIYRVEYTRKGNRTYVYSRLVQVGFPEVADRYYNRPSDERINRHQFATVLERVRKKKAAKLVTAWEDNNIAIINVSAVDCLNLKPIDRK